MRIIYSPEYTSRYTTNPVESPERVLGAAKALKDYQFLQPRPASMEEISRVHGQDHIQRVRYRGLYPPAALAAGGACLAADLALQGEPSFALVRPPGHHASANRSWGLCFFNNLAIALRHVLDRLEKVMVLDIDLHFGDGTVSIFRGESSVRIVNPGAVDMNFDYLQMDSSGYLSQVEWALKGDYDLVAVSAGFDTYERDWGGLLSLEDYRNLGSMIKEASEKICAGRRFAVLEGGYHAHLGYCIRSFVQGFG